MVNKDDLFIATREGGRERISVLRMKGGETEMAHTDDLFNATLTFTLSLCKEKKAHLGRKESRKNESKSPSSSCDTGLRCTWNH